MKWMTSINLKVSFQFANTLLIIKIVILIRILIIFLLSKK